MGNSYISSQLQPRSNKSQGLGGRQSHEISHPSFSSRHILCCPLSRLSRVVLEVLQRLSSSLLNTVRCTGYLLMAGAVPMDQLQLTGRLGSSARIPSKRYCLHSWHDAVLMGAFPPRAASVRRNTYLRLAGCRRSNWCAALNVERSC